MSGRDRVVLAVLAALLAGVCLARLMVGDTFGWPGGDLLNIRLDRMAIGLTVGVALAVGGVLLQALLRNPLASPYVLGVSSGAAVGVMISFAGWLSFLATAATHTAALAGAIGTMVIVYLCAQKRGRVDPIGLLLVGVIANAINGAIIMFVNYINPLGMRGDMIRWMMGYIDDNIEAPRIALIGIVTLVGVVIAWVMGRAMDVATFSDTEAHSVGLNLAKLRLVLFAVAGVLTAGAVMLAGPVGFVGLICPHMIRALVGPTHRTLIAGSALAGAIMVVAADTLIKLIAVRYNIGLMPLGVLTAIIGGPAFLFMLRPHLGRGMET
ncbi:MAG: iron chelate uptake ABC transporter family permease subunit [Planctomycetes bacterium]|nr:iron chelate uptake ABC transporter family permease subunit [Planctomycetota bacterium]